MCVFISAVFSMMALPKRELTSSSVKFSFYKSITSFNSRQKSRKKHEFCGDDKEISIGR